MRVNNSEVSLEGRTASSGRQRINYLDALKFLGIILVVEGHVWDLGMDIDTYSSVSGMMLYSFNMPIFFFVSGFLAYKERLNTADILKRAWNKCLFLVLPAIVFLLFSDLLHHQNPLHVISDGFGNYWFTITLFECFLVYYLISLVCRNSTIQMVVLVLLAIAGVGALSLWGEFGPPILDLNRLTKYFQYFVFGLLAMKHKTLFEKTMQNEGLKLIGIISFFALLFSINNPIWPSAVFHLLRDLVLRYLGTFVVVSFFVCHCSLFDRETRINRIICSIGQKSLAIYLLQYFFIPDFCAFPEWVAGLDGFSVHVISFAYTVIIVATCWLFISLLSNSRLVGRYLLGQK